MLQALFGLTCFSWPDPWLTAGLGCSCARREDNIIELRKNKRDENLQKKRMVHGGPSYAMEESSARTGMALQNKVGRGGSSGVCWGGGWPAVRLAARTGPCARRPRHGCLDRCMCVPACSNWTSCR